MMDVLSSMTSGGVSIDSMKSVSVVGVKMTLPLALGSVSTDGRKKILSILLQFDAAKVRTIYQKRKDRLVAIR